MLILTIKLHINYLKNPHKSYTFATYNVIYSIFLIKNLSILIKSLIIFLRS